MPTAAQHDFKNQSDPNSPQSGPFIEPMISICTENVKNMQGVAPTIHTPREGQG